MGEAYLGTQNLMFGSDLLDSPAPIARRAYSAPAQAADYPRLREYQEVSEATGSYDCTAYSVRNDREQGKGN
ncbi:MAG: hypothetical protein AB2L14_37030 [Candidatus Xenobiia bacterium LiM19]